MSHRYLIVPPWIDDTAFSRYRYSFLNLLVFHGVDDLSIDRLEGLIPTASSQRDFQVASFIPVVQDVIQ